MSEERFDQVESALDRIRSRRSVLKAGLGAALGAGALMRPDAAGAGEKTGIVSITVPNCGGPATLTATVEVNNPTSGATLVFGLSANLRGGGGFFDTAQRASIVLVAGQTTYQVSFDVSAFQALLPTGQTEYNSLRVDAVGGAAGTFDASVLNAKSRSIPPCGAASTTTTPAPTTTTSPPPTTTIAPTTTASPSTTTSPPTTTAQPTSTAPPTTAPPTSTAPPTTAWP